MRLSIRVIPLTLTAVLLVAATSCGHRSMDPAPNGQIFLPPVQPVSCPGFVLDSTDIHVTAAGDTFVIGPDHSIEFAPGAVSAPATYRIVKGSEGSPQWAQVEIRPMNGAPTRFHADVFLNLSYASCPTLDPKNGEIQLLKLGSRGMGVGGRADPVSRTLRAMLPHLSMFTIAQ